MNPLPAKPTLTIPPEDDPLRHLVSLRRQLQQENTAKELEQLQPILDSTESAVIALLMTATAPLPAPQRTLAQTLSEIYGLWHKQLAAASAKKMTDISHGLMKQLTLALITHTQVPKDLWPTAMTLAACNDECRDILRAMLALTVIQPESHTPRSLWFLRGLLLQEARHVTLRQTAPDAMEGWHWLDNQGNLSTSHLRLSHPNATSQILFFQCPNLATRIDALLQEFEDNPSHPLLLLDFIPAAEVKATLNRVAEQWQAPASRRFNRRRQESRVSLCTRLDQLWAALGEAPVEPEECSDWMVLNESAGGYALMHAKGPVTSLIAGHALGLKIAGKPWSLCLVRWVRSENSAHIEAGVELLSPSAIPVRLTLPEREPQPAFLLPALPGLDRSEALLAPREEWGEEHNFVLLTEKSGQLRLTSCLRGTPRHQTSGIEVFEFSRLGRED